MGSEKPLFSVVVIARNEEKTLPRLLESLKEFRERGGEVVVCDTGSTDNTDRIAFDADCLVAREKFTREIGRDEAGDINARFVVQPEPAIVEEGESFFDFSAARNYAASLATTELICMPDCDEIYTALDIDKINQAIRDGATRLEYDFVFSHDPEGKPLIQFPHSKFYDRRVFKWVGIVHEVLHGDGKTTRLEPGVIKLEHYQNPEQSRGQYLTGLAVDCFQNPDNDRSAHYLAREIMWSGRYRSAIQLFERHIEMNKWAPEQSQSEVFVGDCWKHLGDPAQAVRHWWNATAIDCTRREPWLRLAEHYFQKDDRQRTACYAEAALAIPYKGYYCDQMVHYRNVPHHLLYWAYFLDDKARAKTHWEKALAFATTHPTYLHDARFFLNLPSVSIVIPHLGRPEKLKALRERIAHTANYPNFDEVVEEDSFTDRQGVAKVFKRGVEKANGELICYLSNDCEPEDGWLIQAVLVLLGSRPHNQVAFEGEHALVALNDGLWNGQLATHWLAPRTLAYRLDAGEFFHTGYKHVGCDNELTAFCKAMGRYSYAPLAKVNHKHQDDEVSKLAWNEADVKADRELLKKRLSEFGLSDIVPT